MDQDSVHDTTNIIWQKPPLGFVKCNVDASFFHHEQKTEVGLCLRDDFGAYIMAKSVRWPHLLSVREGEAEGLLVALYWMQELGYANIIFELDCKVVVDSVSNSTLENSEFSSIIQNCRDNILMYL